MSNDPLRALAERWKSEASAEVARVGVAGAVLEGIRSSCATELLALLDSLPVQPALTADEVLEIVRTAFCCVDCLAGHPDVPRVAAHIADKLAGRAVALSATARRTIACADSSMPSTVCRRLPTQNREAP